MASTVGVTQWGPWGPRPKVHRNPHPILELCDGYHNMRDMLRTRVQRTPLDGAAAWYKDGEELQRRINFQETYDGARARAAVIQAAGGKVGDIATIFYNLEDTIEVYITCWACWISGIAVVPVYPPAADPQMKRLDMLMNDCHANLILTTQHVIDTVIEPLRASGRKFPTAVPTDKAEGHKELIEQWKEEPVDELVLALLQYTSGSTGHPKGVMVCQGNLIANCIFQLENHGMAEHSNSASWLPFFHNLGLIANMCMSVFSGFCVHMMSPQSFLERPFRYMKLLSDQKCNLAAAANFALDQLVLRVTDAKAKTLDLSHMQMVFIGGEAVRTATLNNFLKKYECAGLKANMLMPSYGLSESTLQVCTLPKGDPVRARSFDAKQLEHGHVVQCDPSSPNAREIVSNGLSFEPERSPVRIVDPNTLQCLPNFEIGEIWFTGPSVALGYLNKPEDTEATFRAHMAGHPDQRPYLRTGDLGFTDEDGHVYIMGRCKELIIINGANHHPKDIEETVDHAMPAGAAACLAAFSIDQNGGEQLVVVIDVADSFPIEEKGADLVPVISAAINKEHGLQPHTLAFCKVGTIGRTASNKVMRRGCHDKFVSGGVKAAARFWWSVADN